MGTRSQKNIISIQNKQQLGSWKSRWSPLLVASLCVGCNLNPGWLIYFVYVWRGWGRESLEEAGGTFRWLVSIWNILHSPICTLSNLSSHLLPLEDKICNPKPTFGMDQLLHTRHCIPHETLPKNAALLGTTRQLCIWRRAYFFGRGGRHLKIVCTFLEHLERWVNTNNQKEPLKWWADPWHSVVRKPENDSNKGRTYLKEKPSLEK